MKAFVVYDSYFINTLKIAEAIADSLREEGVQVSLERIYQLDFSDLEGVGLIVVGAPTHNRNMPGPVKSVLKRLPANTFAGIKTATFDTRYKMSSRKSGSAAIQIARMIKKLDGEEHAPPESFFVMERRGPLYAGELERARTWAASLIGGNG